MSDSSTSNSSSDSDKDQTPPPVLDLLQISIEAGRSILGNATPEKIPCRDSGSQGVAYIQEVLFRRHSRLDYSRHSNEWSGGRVLSTRQSCLKSDLNWILKSKNQLQNPVLIGFLPTSENPVLIGFLPTSENPVFLDS
ncbi:hypothetical protein CROQUDRAFT_98750 [Cronartium quercuum f. sp. fusiforme G11]|uniref:Uncharacterized protein n=1 Tax=Cronartium quercuum f. sp. fusiforme G11 TaxID=708437 RepID=A0A9P6T7D7_9BASI|nr:hypothetical protein CROQUDRAFT_98750 [Cronartium quercuum f. sp. fusiforme G11]